MAAKLTGAEGRRQLYKVKGAAFLQQSLQTWWLRTSTHERGLETPSRALRLHRFTFWFNPFYSAVQTWKSYLTPLNLSFSIKGQNNNDYPSASCKDLAQCSAAKQMNHEWELL